MKKISLFLECFAENVHIYRRLNEFHVEKDFCQYLDCLTKILHTVSILTKLFLLSILLLTLQGLLERMWILLRSERQTGPC